MSTTPVAVSTGHFLPSSRYRHPGDVIRLICGGILLAGAVTASAVASRWLLGPAAPAPDALGSGSASRVLTGMVQAACAAAAALVVAATLGRRRFRLLAGLAAGAAVAAVIFHLLGDHHPDVLADNLTRDSWIASAAFPGPP